MVTAKSWMKKVTGGSVGGQNFMALSIGQTVFAATSWGVLSALALLGSAQDVGELAFALAIVTPTFAISKLRLRTVLATDVHHEYSLSDYLSTSVLGVIVSIPLTIVLAILLGAGTGITSVVAWVALSRGFESMSHISYGYQQRTDRMTPIGISVGVRGVVSLALAAGAFALTGSVAWAAAGLAVGHALLFVSYDYGYLRAGLGEPGERTGLSWRVIRRLTVVTFPLGLYAFFNSLSDNIPRIVLERDSGLAELGIFATFGYTVTGVAAITRALDGAATPRISRALARRDEAMVRQRIRGLTMVASAIGGVALLLAVTVGRSFLDFAFGPEFAAHSAEFTWMAVYAWMVLVVAGWTVTLTAARRFKVQLSIQVASVVSVFLSALALIPVHGLMGAVGSLLIGGTVRVISTAVIVRRVLQGVAEMTDHGDGGPRGSNAP
jgi:O-antigen/teichoic acid export membrane protein